MILTLRDLGLRSPDLELAVFKWNEPARRGAAVDRVLSWEKNEPVGQLSKSNHNDVYRAGEEKGAPAAVSFISSQSRQRVILRRVDGKGPRTGRLD